MAKKIACDIIKCDVINCLSANIIVIKPNFKNIKSYDFWYHLVFNLTKLLAFLEKKNEEKNQGS